MKGEGSDLMLLLDAVAPLVLFPAATGAALAGIFGRNRIAVALLVIAASAVLVPLAYALWSFSQMPPEAR